MRHALLLSFLLSLMFFGASQPVAAQATVQRGELRFSTVVEWQAGLAQGVQITNNDDGELRLANGQIEGIYTSGIAKIDFPAAELGAVWQAVVPAEAELRLEARGGPTPEQLQSEAWQPLPSGDARSQRVDGAFATESLVVLAPGSAFVQFRATLKAKVTNASPVLSDLSLSYFDASAGPALSAGLTRATAPFGPATLTPAPSLILRPDWSGNRGGSVADRQAPRGIVLHQIGSDNLGDNPLPYVRALSAFHSEVLGWDDLAYHFIIDGAGTVLQGHAGGPTATVSHFADGDDAIQIALVGQGAATNEQRTALVGLLAWLGESYNIPPTGQHIVANASASRQNIVVHRGLTPGGSDPSAALTSQLPAIRLAADAATVRSRWYFAEGNPFDYIERLAVLNTSANEANVRFRLLRQPGPAVEVTRTVPANGRFELTVNSVFSDTTNVPAIIESNQPMIAERFMDFQTDVTASPGVQTPQRVWYFAEGSTDGDFKTFLVLFNPQNEQVEANLTYMKGDGTTAAQSVQIPPQQRTVVAVNTTLPGVGFGTRVIANQPIVAERTMIFGSGSTINTGGVHSTPGVGTLARRWFFAEGTTEPPFTMAVLVLNPNAQPANVAVTFSNQDGVSLTRRYAVPPTSRLAINVNEFVPQLGVATVIESDRPIAAERAMYWRNFSVGTVAPGAAAPAFTWRFANGRTSNGFQEYLLFNNPNKNQARVTVDFVLANGSNAQQSVVMPGNARYTMAVHQIYPDQSAISATVRSTQPIIAERSLYPNAPTANDNRGGSTSFGVPEP